MGILKETKSTFYKRYGASGNYLHYTFTGTLCPLLGHTEIAGAPFLSCTLSMGAGMFARRLDGDVIKTQSADSDRRFSYTPGTPAELYKGSDREIARLVSAFRDASGAEILCKSSAPKFLPQKAEFATSFVRSLAKTGGVELGRHETAAIAACDEHIEPYLALAYAKSGYVTLVGGGVPSCCPLPLTGYKIIFASCGKKIPNRSEKIHAILIKLRKRFPELDSVLRLDAEHAYYAKSVLGGRPAEYVRHLAEENTRIKSALHGLKKLDVKTLFRAMNASQYSMESARWIGGELVSLALAARNADAKAVRCCENGVVIVAEAEDVDFLVKSVRHDFENAVGFKPNFCIADAV